MITKTFSFYGEKKEIESNGYFAYDGCHKIYVIEDDADLKQAKEWDYIIMSIDEIERTFRTSCELRFISNWKLTKRYVPQHDDF